MVWIAVGVIVLGTVVAVLAAVLSSAVAAVKGERLRVADANAVVANAAREVEECRKAGRGGGRDVEAAERRLAFAREAAEQVKAAKAVVPMRRLAERLLAPRRRTPRGQG